MPSPGKIMVLGGVAGGVEVVEAGMGVGSAGLGVGAVGALGRVSPACSVGRESLRAGAVLRIVLGTGMGGRLDVRQAAGGLPWGGVGMGGLAVTLAGWG